MVQEELIRIAGNAFGPVTDAHPYGSYGVLRLDGDKIFSPVQVSEELTRLYNQFARMKIVSTSLKTKAGGLFCRIMSDEQSVELFDKDSPPSHTMILNARNGKGSRIYLFRGKAGDVALPQNILGMAAFNFVAQLDANGRPEGYRSFDPVEQGQAVAGILEEMLDIAENAHS
ncbi:MAG: hypothetical protein H6861_00480 [Rhodospirillales bacterium]|nr:hypothetical protein [Rhodospirillales bacterium]